MTNLDKSDVLDGLFAVWDEIDTVLAALADEQMAGADSAAGLDRA